MFIEKQRERKQDRIIYSRNGKQFGSWVNNHRIPYPVPAIARNLGEWWARDTSWVPREHLFGLYMVQVWGVKRQAGRCTWMFTRARSWRVLCATQEPKLNQAACSSLSLYCLPQSSGKESFALRGLGPHSPMGTMIPMTAAVTVEPIWLPSFPSVKHQHFQSDALPLRIRALTGPKL